MKTRSDMGDSSDTIRRYVTALLLTIVVFGLGYICGQQTGKAVPAFEKANGLSGPPSRASARSEFFQQQKPQRKAALIV
ncbi:MULTISPECIES: hypothetical protein [Undibacterium]|jgi:hypothetical protein|uniref:Uncharacterized protein n=1 Tax=Undibacterium umbellatum TaxID=2762300 RepID=A0ABR6Z5X9_9BURK|nr:MULTISPECIES: hypothetical protein [Undibacterium]MBC3906956.1 hypothetical protein [Undibacterium umbellatum]MDP1976563.1 hypothetical protein [Undibacterium sp.]